MRARAHARTHAHHSRTRTTHAYANANSHTFTHSCAHFSLTSHTRTSRTCTNLTHAPHARPDNGMISAPTRALVHVRMRTCTNYTLAHTHHSLMHAHTHSLAHSHTRTHMHAQLHKHALRARSYARSWMHAHTHTHTHRHFLTQARSAHAHSHTRSLASISPPTQNPRVRNASMMAFSCGRPVAHASERHSRQRRMWWWWSPSSSSSWSSCTRSTR